MVRCRLLQIINQQTAAIAAAIYGNHSNTPNNNARKILTYGRHTTSKNKIRTDRTGSSWRGAAAAKSSQAGSDERLGQWA
jgi:hypothetical protein